MGNAADVGNLFPYFVGHAVVETRDVGHLLLPFALRTGLVGQVDEHHVAVRQFLLQRFHCRDTYLTGAAPCGPEVDKDGLAGILCSNGPDEFVASHVGCGHHTLLRLPLYTFYEQTDAVVVLTKWCLKDAVGSQDGAVRKHFKGIHPLYQMVFVGQCLQRLVRLSLPHSVGFEVRYMVSVGGEIKRATALINQHVLEVWVYQRIGLGQMR